MLHIDVNLYIEFREEVFSIDGSVVFCKVCAVYKLYTKQIFYNNMPYY